MATRIWRIAVVVLVALAVGVLAGCNAADQSLDRIQSAGILRVGLDPTYPPFELAEKDGVTGFDVDLAHEIAAGLGVSPQFTYFGYDGLYDALATDQVDVLISALVISPERTREFGYSQPYYDAGQVLVLPETSTITGPNALGGQRVAVELGALGHVETLSLARSQPDLAVLPFGSADEALLAVAGGEADAAVVDSISARLFLGAAHGDGRLLRLAPTPVSAELFAVVTRIEDEALLEQIDNELARLDADGRLEDLISRWLGP